MAYVALYRQWRPQNFDTLVGQQPVKQALKNALTSGRIAHAYLFAGPRGTGKTSTARILAKALNCVHGPTAEPCGECENCRRIAEGTSMDVFEIDAASNRGIDEIKALRDQLAFAPVDCRYKVYIIDEVHMLTTEAFNALLKTLEEPPAHVIFILATTDPHKIPATIHSRCQRFDFRRVTVDEIAQHLAMVAEGSGLAADADALRMIAIQSEGGMRDALSLLDQCGVMGQQITAASVREVLGIVGREALRELVRAVGQQDVGAALAQLNALLEQGRDVRQILTELTEYLRALLLYKTVPQYNEIYLTDTAEELAQLAPLYSSERILASQERLHTAILELRGTMRSRITAELCLLELCRREGNALASLSARLESLEQQLAGGAVRYVPQEVASPASARTEAVRPAPAVRRETEAAAPQPSVQAAPKAQVPAEAPQQPSVQPAPKAKPKREAVQAASAPAVQEYGGDYAAGEDFWQQTLELVRSEKKMSMYSCAKDGRVYSFENDVLVVTFKIAFKSERMNRPDFRGYFEELLLRLARRPIRLQCESEESVRASAVKAAPKPQRAAKVQAEQSAPVAQKRTEAEEAPQVPDNLQKALNALGGKLTAVD